MRGRQAVFELLEARHLLAFVAWDGGGDGASWTDPQNWSTNQLPGVDDDVEIDVSQNPYVVLGGGSQSIHSLRTAEAFLLSGATLQITETLQIENGFSLDGGRIIGGVLTTSDGASLTVDGFGVGGTLDGVTLNGNAKVQNLATLTVTNGLTLNGTLTVTSNEGGGRSQVVFTAGPQSLLGTGEIVMGGTSRLLLGNNILTFGPDITVRGQGSIEQGAASTVISQGTIVADQPGRLLWANVDSFVNQGRLAARNGGSLDIVGLTGDLGTATLADSSSRMALAGTTYVINQPLSVAAGQTLTLNSGWSNQSSLNVTGGVLRAYPRTLAARSAVMANCRWTMAR